MTPGGLSTLTAVYLGVTFGGLAFFWLWEDGAPLRPFPDASARRRHVLRNLGVLVSVILVADLLVGTWILRIGERLLDAPDGLLAPLGLPVAALVAIAFVVVDLYDYVLHRITHRWRPLWLLHTVHHGDPHVDMTTGARHHPIEIAVGLCGRIGVYVVFGLPLWIEVARVIVANAHFLWQHANVAAPRWLERLRIVIVTPAVHRQHHSPTAPLIDRNFGQMFTVWDRLFGTYAEPSSDAPPEYGLRKLADERWQTVAGMLLTPFRAHALTGTL